MSKIIFIHNQQVKLDEWQLIQAGGEGMVFRLNGTAVKLYHQPTPQRQNKLAYLLNSGLVERLPTAVLAPCAPVSNDQQELIGFQMPLLPANSQPLKQLANPIFRQKHHITPSSIIPLLQHIHTTVTQLHQTQVIIGDLNDTNLFFTHYALRTTHWIDSDSYQFAHFPCPVAMPAFLDPHLYEVADFGARPSFTSHTDWYAFTVLLVKSLLAVHPYGGTHGQYKTLRARAQAGVSILNTAVTLPTTALPLDTLSDDLLHYLHRVFEKGERPSFPAVLLEGALRGKVSSKQLTVNSQVARRTTHYAIRELFTTAGFIEQLAILPTGRILAIVHENNSYQLVRLGIGGTVDEVALFNGSPGYRFAVFGGRYVAVNPPQRSQLLILDVNGTSPQKVAMLETAAFRDTAVFAATPQHLYRIAGNWIMRGRVQNGHYLEEAIATAHKNQTWFTASPYNEAIAGCHRLFADYRFFVQTERGSYDLALPPLAAGEHIAEVGMAFGRDTVAVGLKVTGGYGRTHTHAHIFSFTGQPTNTWQTPDDTLEKLITHYPITQLPEDVLETAVAVAATLRQHPAGLLIQEPSRLLFQPTT
jgi:hypothetical protein